ncbi:MAG: Na(+)-translocating NADH-quinone reductase subunit A [Succinivibrionaceae bacterium]|nr:Na(+)-translocating NADH-quinone reductase subunit A [Succinivibrionaceae bacterium]
MINIKKGLDLPIGGQPQQSIGDSPEVKHVALISSDFPGLRPSMKVEPGQKVKKGQVLFEDKKNPGSCFTAPAGGEVVAVNRGERRAFQSVVIEVDSDAGAVTFDKVAPDAIHNLSADVVLKELVESGMWTAFRTRPFDKVPKVGSLPHSIFVTAIDTNPLAVDPRVVIAQDQEAFSCGLEVLSRIGVHVYVCKGEGSLPVIPAANVSEEIFTGPHPAGLPGTHIHFLDPVSDQKTVWHIGYQDVIAIGHLFTEGEIYSTRIIALGGPMMREPRLIRTIAGASIAEITAGQVESSPEGVRVISGSVLWGNTAVGPFAYLGHYHLQVAALEEGGHKDFLLQGWMGPGFRRHSATRAFASAFIKPESYTFNTAVNGGPRPMLPIEVFDQVMPLDIEATVLLRAVEINDVEQARLLGLLELSEEDLALCTYVCPGKTDYGPLLRRSLTKIEVEG